MHLFTIPGTPVIFHGEDGHGSEGIIAQTFLIPGNIYTVQSIDITHRWVQLAEWADHWWNVDMFDDASSDPDNDGDDDSNDDDSDGNDNS